MIDDSGTRVRYLKRLKLEHDEGKPLKVGKPKQEEKEP
jgi:hypothetical protein